MPSDGSEEKSLSSRTVFIDRNSGGRTFKSLLTDAGIKVVLHDEMFPAAAKDDEWLTLVGNPDYLIVTGDKAIARNPLFLGKFKSSKATVFILNALNGLSREGKAECIKSVYAKMVALGEQFQPPALWRVGKNRFFQRLDHTRILALMKRRAR